MQVLNQKGAARAPASACPAHREGLVPLIDDKRRFCLSKVVLTDYSNVHGLHIWIHFAASVEWCLQQTRRFSFGHCDMGRTSAVSLIFLVPIHLCACKGGACIKHWNALGFFQLLHFSVSLETSNALQRSSCWPRLWSAGMMLVLFSGVWKPDSCLRHQIKTVSPKWPCYSTRVVQVSHSFQLKVVIVIRILIVTFKNISSMFLKCLNIMYWINSLQL